MAMSPQEAAAAGLGWVPKDNPNYGKPGFVGYQAAPTPPTSSDPAAPPADPSAPPPDASTPPSGDVPFDSGAPNAPPKQINGDTPPPAGSVDPFAASGGGTYINGQWLPNNNPGAIARARAASGAGGAAPPPPAGAPPAGPSEPGGTAPNGGPNPTTTSPDDQQKLRDILVKMMGQDPTKVDMNDPALRAQLDPYAAARQRSMNEEISNGAEGAFANAQDFGAPEKLAASERAGQDVGLRASDLAGKEISAKRQEVHNALTQYGSMLSDDQRRQLEKYQTDLDATIKREGLAQTGQLGNRELDIREELGKMGLDRDLIDTILRNLQFGQDLGYRIGATEQSGNQTAANSVT